MKLNLFAAVTLSGVVSGHYTFDSLILPDGTITGSWEYVREHFAYEKVFAAEFPDGEGMEEVRITPYDRDFTCNINATDSAHRTGVATVPAGSTIGMHVYNGGILGHPGPGTVYMSKAPGSVADYDGSGPWFKIHQESICDEDGSIFDTAWCTFAKPSLNFTIPANVPSGEYLVRAEHLAVHWGNFHDPQFYFSCAQIKVTDGGDGVPSPTVTLPGYWSPDDPALNFNIYRETEYPYTVGPELWTG